MTIVFGPYADSVIGSALFTGVFIVAETLCAHAEIFPLEMLERLSGRAHHDAVGFILSRP